MNVVVLIGVFDLLILIYDAFFVASIVVVFLFVSFLPPPPATE
jgi:hypothetical protein